MAVCASLSVRYSPFYGVTPDPPLRHRLLPVVVPLWIDDEPADGEQDSPELWSAEIEHLVGIVVRQPIQFQIQFGVA